MKYIVLLLLLPGCLLHTPPDVEIPPGYTSYTYQQKAGADCSEMLAKGVSYEWDAPMIVIDRHYPYFHKRKRVDVIKRQQAACHFDWHTHICSCEVYSFVGVSPDEYGAPGFSHEHFEFNACGVLHERRQLP